MCNLFTYSELLYTMHLLIYSTAFELPKPYRRPICFKLNALLHSLCLFFFSMIVKKTPYTCETIVVRNTFIIIAGKQQQHEITNGESYIVRREYFPRVNENTGPSKN